jgi:hypothetical protein
MEEGCGVGVPIPTLFCPKIVKGLLSSIKQVIHMENNKDLMSAIFQQNYGLMAAF